LEPGDLLLDYKTAISVPQARDMRHAFDKYMSLPLTEWTALELGKMKRKSY